MIDLKSYASRTDKGPYLQINEDNVEVDLVNKLYMLFDSFGGSSVGDKAVFLVLDTIKKFYTRIAGDPEATLPFFYSPKYLLEGNALINAMEYAHFLLKKENKDKEMDSKGGASCIAISQAENILTLAATGNCLGLIYSKGNMKVISNPDNFEFISGDFYDKEFVTAPASGFGLFNDLHLNISEVRVNSGDRILLLSDGVYARVNHKEIKDIILSEGTKSSDKIDMLFDLANKRGNMDNQSALLLNF
ncbi:MAG: hypothetical protein CME63_12085 [Halobacteriovoraceae bacterium]|nr:hypothetical protein [Halobacteriovoraceae bacterium]